MSLDKPEVIDLVSFKDDVVTISLVATEPWDSNGQNALRLQSKLKNYVAFAADGQLLRFYPEMAGKQVVIRIHSDYELGETERRLVAAAQQHWCDPDGIKLVVTIAEPMSTKAET